MFWQWASIETYVYVLGYSHVTFPMLYNLKPRSHIMARKRELSRGTRRCREGTGKERLCSLRGKYRANAEFLFLCASQTVINKESLHTRRKKRFFFR